MKKQICRFRTTVFILTLSASVILFGCADVRLNTLPTPSPTAKLRVFVLPITSTSAPRGAWMPSEKEFAENQHRNASRILQIKGIYSVIPQEEVFTVTGDQRIEGWQWAQGDWKLARDAGQALHADYICIVERKFSGVVTNKLLLISLSTGKIFEETMVMPRMGSSPSTSVTNVWDEAREMMMNSYRGIFMAAKGDMFATAIRKRRSGVPGRELKAPESVISPAEKKRPTPPARPIGKGKTSGFKATEPDPSASSTPYKKPPAAPVAMAKEKNGRTGQAGKDMLPKGLEAMVERQKAVETGKSRLVVYDFDAGEQLGVVAMILSEALREELHELGKFLLVNRENIVHVMDELKLQQSGMVDENQAVQLGKWLAANETVTGKLAVLGNVYVLQAKRTDIQSLGTLGIGSLKTSMGKEEELLNSLPELAKKLAGAP